MCHSVIPGYHRDQRDCWISPSGTFNTSSNSSSPFTWERCRWCEICKRSDWVPAGVVLQINWLLQEQLANTSGQPRAGAKCEAAHKNNIHITRQEARGVCQMSDVRCQPPSIPQYLQQGLCQNTSAGKTSLIRWDAFKFSSHFCSASPGQCLQVGIGEDFNYRSHSACWYSLEENWTLERWKSQTFTAFPTSPCLCLHWRLQLKMLLEHNGYNKLLYWN